MKRLFKFGLPTVFSAIMLAVVSTSAFADPRDFTFQNDSGSYIYHLYVSPSNSSSWGSDVLGRDVLAPGERETIRFNPNIGDSCYYDILVVNADGVRTRKDGENLCAITVEHYTES